MQAHLKTSILYCEKYRFLKFLLSPLQPTEWFFFCLVCHMLVDYRKIEKPWKNASFGRLKRWKWQVFFQNFEFKILKLLKLSKKFWWPKKPWNHPKTMYIWIYFLTRPLKNTFLPKRDHNCQIGQMGKGVRKININFWPLFFFLTSQHISVSPKKIWEKNSVLNF